MVWLKLNRVFLLMNAQQDLLSQTQRASRTVIASFIFCGSHQSLLVSEGQGCQLLLYNKPRQLYSVPRVLSTSQHLQLILQMKKNPKYTSSNPRLNNIMKIVENVHKSMCTGLLLYFGLDCHFSLCQYTLFCYFY